METRIALFRGVNVGGNNKLPMVDLVSDLESLGLKQIRTCIQSGNAVFVAPKSALKGSHDRLAAAIGIQVEKNRGFRPEVMILTTDQLASAIEQNPFPQAMKTPNQLHISFLASVPGKPNLDKLNSLKADSEQFKLIGERFYLFAPDGIGRSKLAAGAEKTLGVPATSRNMKTVLKIAELVSQQ